MKQKMIGAFIKLVLTILIGFTARTGFLSAQTDDLSGISLKYSPPKDNGQIAASISWTAKPMGYYNVQRSLNLIDWSTVGQASGPTLTPHMTDSGRAWNGIASSYNGTKIVAAVYYGYIYTSTDSGATWIQRTGSGMRAWNYVVSDASGSKLAASIANGYIYTSTDSGITWMSQIGSGSRSWVSLASDSTGTKLVGIVNGGYIYSSVDSGITWSERLNDVPRSWVSVTSSSDGTKLAALANNDYIYTSINSGATWMMQTSVGIRPWTSIASDSTGNNLVATTSLTGLYKSTTAGNSWVYLDYWNIQGMKSLSVSSDSSSFICIAGAYNTLLMSQDFGVNGYNSSIPMNSGKWILVSLSGDGKRIYAIESNGYIYTATVGKMSFNLYEESQGVSRCFYRLLKP